MRIIDRGSRHSRSSSSPASRAGGSICAPGDRRARRDRSASITFSLCGERGCPSRSIPHAASTTSRDQIDAALDSRGIRPSDRVRRLVRRPRSPCASPRRGRSGRAALVLVVDARTRLAPQAASRALRALPWIFGPAVLAESPWRLRREIARAIPGIGARLRFALRQLRTFVRAPVCSRRMARARRADRQQSISPATRRGFPCRRSWSPASPDSTTSWRSSTTSEYAALIADARASRSSGRVTSAGHPARRASPRSSASSSTTRCKASEPCCVKFRDRPAASRRCSTNRPPRAA